LLLLQRQRPVTPFGHTGQIVTAILGIEIEVNLAWRGSLIYSMAGFESAFASAQG
jgi:hypothetical protein